MKSRKHFILTRGQNNLMELWSLVHWLGFELYAGPGRQLFREQIEAPCKRGSQHGFKRLQVGWVATVQ